MKRMSYADAGVDIDREEEAVRDIVATAGGLSLIHI